MKEGDRFDIVLTDGPDNSSESEPTVRPVQLEEGKPIPANVALIKAMPCEDHPGRLHAEVVYAPEQKKRAKKPERTTVGPARVSNTRFRSGWDQVFGGDKQLN